MKISIITIHLDDFSGLRRTQDSLAALLNDNDTDVEWIVVDGGSKVQNDHVDALHHAGSCATHFVSEPDEGIYDAMNKGTGLATGDYLLFLNAGDELHPDFEPDQLKSLVETDMPEMVWGRSLERYQDGTTIEIKTRSPSWAWYCMPVYHPAIFFRQENLGTEPYNTDFKIAADYDLLCRLLSDGAEVKMLDSVVSIFYRGGISLTEGEVTGEEENRIRLKYFNVPVIAGSVIMSVKFFTARLSHFVWLRRTWRKWI